MTLKLALVGLGLFLMVAPSFQYGTILVDTVHPVKNDAVHFSSARSDTAVFNEFDVGSLTLSNPDGFFAEPPGTADFTGATVDVHGELGVAFGTPGSDTTISADGAFTGLTQALNINADNTFSVSTADDLTFESGRTLAVTAQAMDLEGLFGFVVESRLGNLDVSSGVEIFSFSDAISINADDTLSIDSVNEIDFTSAGHAMEFNAKRVNMLAIEEIELISEQDVTLTAEDAIHTYAGSSELTSLGDINFVSGSRNVDFTAADTTRISADTIDVSASDFVYLTATEYSQGHANLWSQGTTTINADSALFFASNDVVVRDSSRHTVNANSADFTLDSEIHIGTPGTGTIDISDEQSLTFSVTQDVGEEFDVVANRQLSLSGADVAIDSVADVLVNGAILSVEAEVLNVSGNGASIAALDSNGANIDIEGDDVSFAAGDNLNVNGNRVFFTADDLFQTSGGSHTESIALQYQVSSETMSITSLGADATLSGSNIELSVGDILMENGSSGTISSNNGDISIFEADFDVNQAGSVTFSTSNDFFILLNSDDDEEVSQFDSLTAEFSAGGDLSVTAAESAMFIMYSDDTDLNIDSIGNGAVTFANTNTDGEGESNFNAVDEIDFFGNVVGPVPATVTSAETSFDAGGDVNVFFDDLTIIGSESVTFTSTTPGGSVVIFDGTDTTLSSISTTSISSGGDVSFSWNTNTFNNPTLTITSLDTSQYSAEGIDIAGSAITDVLNPTQYNGAVVGNIDNGLAFNAFNAFSVNSDDFDGAGDIGLVSASSISTSAVTGFSVNAGGDITHTGGAISYSAGEALGVTARGSLTLGAPADGAFVNIHSSEGDINFSSTTVDFDSDTWLSHSTDLNIYARSDITFDAPEIIFRGRTLDVIAGGDYTIDANVIVIDSLDTEGTSSTDVGTDATVRSEEEVFFTSDGDITFESTAPTAGVGIAVSTKDLTLVSDQSFHAEADTGILNVLALNDDDDKISFHSGGHTTFLAETGNADILSEDLVSIKAGRSLQLQSFLEDGIDVTAEIGHFVVSAPSASVYFEGSDFFNITADNPTTDTDTADISFNAAHGISVETEIGGVLFEAFSPVPTSPTDTILITSTDDHGDIVFDSARSTIFTEAPLEINFNSLDGSIDSQTFGHTAFASESDLTFTVGAGEFDVNGYRGTQVNAGSDGFPSDLTWTSGGQYDAGANGVIDIRSVGPIAAGDVALALETQAGGVRFVTSNTGDIRLTARNDQTFYGDRFLVTPATNDFYAETVGGAISTFAQLSGNFSTQGGPIEMITTTGTVGGAITFDATNNDITFESGRDATFSAEESIALQAQTGISLLSHDGRVTIAAEASTSNIQMIASNEISLLSVGTRYSAPNDGISFDAVNNVEFGTIETDRITFNSVNLFQIGEHTRPIVDLNAGGSSTQDGFVIQSVGGIFVQSNQTLETSVTDDFEVTAENSVGATSGGPILLSSEQNILLRSLLGVLSLHGDNLDMQATQSIEGTSSGVFSVGSTGRLPSHGVSLQAPLVGFTSQGMEWISHVVNGDVNNVFTITSTGDALIKGFSEAGSDTTISFDANTGLTFQSRDSLEVLSRDRDGTVTFSTQESEDGDLFITTQVSSDIEFNAGAEFGIHTFGPATITSTNSKITFDANDTDAADDGSKGDIEILATGDITATATRNTLYTGEASATIQTTATDGDVGGPLDISSTGEMSITSNLDMTIANTLNEGGSITFTAESDLDVETFEDGSIAFASDLDTTFTAARDLRLENDGETIITVGEDTLIQANGIHPSNDYGVFIDSENDNIEFAALFGALSFVGVNGVEIEITNGLEFFAQTDIAFSGTTATALTGTSFEVESYEGRAEFHGQQGFTFSTPVDISFEAEGSDDLGNHGAAFSSAGRLEVDLDGDISTEGKSGLHVSGSAVSITAEQSLDVTGNNGNFLVDATDYVSFFANDGLSVFSTTNMHMESGGYLFVDSDAEIDINAGNADFVATGTDAGVKGFAAGQLTIDTSSNLFVYSEETPGADVNITTTLGEMIIDAEADIVASAGDLKFNLPADDGDFYITVDDDIDIVSSGAVSFRSDFFTPVQNILGLNIDAADLTITTESDVAMTSQLSMEIDALDFDIDANFARGVGGDILGDATGTIDIDATQFTITSLKEGGNVDFVSKTGDIELTTSSVNIEDSTFVKLPFRNFPGRDRYDPDSCRSGEVYLTNYYHSPLTTQNGIQVTPYAFNSRSTESLLCICDPFPYFSNSQGTGVPFCVPFNEPQCDQFLDPFCPPYPSYYVDLPSN
mmetsp:Transcript_4912/g.17529  ORF Transcript_4912/g.17529 Transcript_4912/m.17529 type:complete len:2285 (-) Transcript_4912:46-6900(-)